jgi:hypothetical protein
MRFWRRLSPTQERDFLDVVFTRLDGPQGMDFNDTNLTLDLRTYAPEFTVRAEAVFFERRDLRTWQYELARRFRDVRGTSAHAPRAAT